VNSEIVVDMVKSEFLSSSDNSVTLFSEESKTVNFWFDAGIPVTSSSLHLRSRIERDLSSF